MQRGLRLLQEAKDQSGNVKVCEAAASPDALRGAEALTVICMALPECVACPAHRRADPPAANAGGPGQGVQGPRQGDIRRLVGSADHVPPLLNGNAQSKYGGAWAMRGSANTAFGRPSMVSTRPASVGAGHEVQERVQDPRQAVRAWAPLRRARTRLALARAGSTGPRALEPRRLWWIKLKATAEAKDWEELDRFAKSKKSPIGYAVRPRPWRFRARCSLVLTTTAQQARGPCPAASRLCTSAWRTATSARRPGTSHGASRPSGRRCSSPLGMQHDGTDLARYADSS